MSAVPGSATAWNQWTTVAQSAAMDLRTLPSDRQSLARAAVEAQRELLAATEAAEHAVARAHALSLQLARALEVLHRTEGPAVPHQTVEQGEPWSRLSPREREVLSLVAEGRSNKAIAEALFVSPNTVKTHVAALLTKLEVDTRVQLAALATRHANWPEAA
jgi:DNA-binding NarL/FixJ family response regulator